MIGISSCTEQEVATVNDSGAQVELRTTTGPCGDAPGNCTDITFLSVRKLPNGYCCVTVQVNIAYPINSYLQTSESYWNNGTYTNTLYPTVTITRLYSSISTYEVCFPPIVGGTGSLSFLIIQPNGQVVTCVAINNPC